MILRIKRGAPPYMLYCLLIAAWICVAQVLGSTILILSCLAVFLLLAAVAAYKGFATPILMFFLPWSPLLKMAPGSQSFYTFALGIVCAVCLVRKNFRVNIYCVLFAIPIFALTMLSKMLENYGISNSYILFIFLLAFFPLVTGELKEQVDFAKLTLFFSVGIVVAALSARYLMAFPRIARYVDVFTLRTVTRLCGYYGDPNFYSAHISAALAGISLLVLQEGNTKHRAGWIILAVVLLYCGFLSVSKSFILVIAVVAALWLYKILRMPIGRNRKMAILLCVFLLAGVVIYAGLFTDMMDMYITRFQSADDVSALTTGRAEVWREYFDALTADGKLLLLGKGFTNVVLTEKATHNTLLQAFFQLGVLGVVFFAGWAWNYVRAMLRHRQIRCAVLDVLILLVGIFLPWMAIDMLFFDELFLMPMYMAAGILYFKGESARRPRKSAFSLTKRKRNVTI